MRRKRKKVGRERGAKVKSAARKTKEFFNLYTKDLTREELQKLLWKEPQQAYHFFALKTDEEELRKLPPVRRFLKIVKNAFLGFTLRMSPARRVFYAVALFAFALGFIKTVNRIDYFPTNLIVAFVILNLLLALELADKLVMKSDLEFAREIQLRLLPQHKLEVEGLDIYGIMVPANTVGGDYYDLLRVSDSKIFIAIGDVSGKGAPAALLMAYLQASVRALLRDDITIGELIRRLNVHLHSNTPVNSLVTFFCGLVDLTAKNFTYSNAGHNAPLLLGEGGKIRKLCEGGIPLGISAEAEFEESSVELHPADLLFLYTDGITEAVNSVGDEFGEDRLEALVTKRRSPRVETLAKDIVHDVETFVKERRFADDLTMVIVSVRETASE